MFFRKYKSSVEPGSPGEMCSPQKMRKRSGERPLSCGDTKPSTITKEQRPRSWSFAKIVPSATRKYQRQRAVRPLSCGESKQGGESTWSCGDTDRMYSLRGERPSSSSTKDDMPCFSRRQRGRRGENSSPSALQKVICQPPPEILPECFIERYPSALDEREEEEELASRRRAEGVHFAWGLTKKSREQWARKRVEKLERAREKNLQKRIEKAIRKEERKIEKREEKQQRKLERERRLEEAEEKEKQELAGRKRWKVNKSISIIWGRKKKDPAIKERERQEKEERERRKREKKERDRQVNEEIRRWQSVAKAEREKRMREKTERKRQMKEEREEKEREKKEKMQRERQEEKERERKIRRVKEERELRKERAERRLKGEIKRQKREKGTQKVVKKKKRKEKKRREKEWESESDKVKDSWLSSLQLWWLGIERDHLDALHRYNVVKEQNLRRGNVKPQAINMLLIERRNLEIDQHRLAWKVKRLTEEQRLGRQRKLRKRGIFTIDDLPIRPLEQ